MDRETFEKILTEEGIDDANLRAMLWYSWKMDEPDELDEEKLKKETKKIKSELPQLLVRQALNRAMDRELGRER